MIHGKCFLRSGYILIINNPEKPFPGPFWLSIGMRIQCWCAWRWWWGRFDVGCTDSVNWHPYSSPCSAFLVKTKDVFEAPLYSPIKKKKLKSPTLRLINSFKIILKVNIPGIKFWAYKYLHARNSLPELGEGQKDLQKFSKVHTFIYLFWFWNIYYYLLLNILSF